LITTRRIGLLTILPVLSWSYLCAAQASTGWTAYDGGPDGGHYSPLKQINRSNVQHLKVAWVWDTGEPGGLQTNPLIVDRTLYAYTPTQKVIALDAATGKPQWIFDSGIHGTQPARGVAGGATAKTSAFLPVS
jgi:quinoprotein glucose dehydrogenase